MEKVEPKTSLKNESNLERKLNGVSFSHFLKKKKRKDKERFERHERLVTRDELTRDIIPDAHL